MPPQSQAPSAIEAKIRHLEERLRQAMLKSDVAELDALIDERLLFIGPDSAVYSKKDDLALHRSGAERIARLEVEELRIEIYPSAAIVVLLANMAGVVNDQAFEAVAAMIFIAYKALLASRARKHVGSLGARPIGYAPNPARQPTA